MNVQTKAPKNKILSVLQTKKFWTDFLIMTFGMGLAALAVHFFLIPSKLIVGSITGLSIVISKLSGIPVSALTFIINCFLLILAYFLIGKEFGLKTVYTGLILSPWLWLFETHFPVSASLMGETWFDLLCFVLILSFVQSILFRINASTGGLDIIGKIINKYLHLDIGKSIAIGGALICSTAFFINDFRLVVVGLIGTWINGLVINHFTDGFTSRKRVHIITNESEKIREFILHDIHRGVTIFNIEGGYSRKNMFMLEVILTNDEFGNLMAYIRKEKIKTFITADNVSEIYGIWEEKTSREKRERNQRIREKTKIIRTE